jgi:hypothetical protein
VKRPGLKTKVVLDMVDTLPEDTKYDLVLDRGFTSPILLKKLLEKGHTATGTCMRDRKGFPFQLLNLDKKAEPGSCKAAVCENNKMVALAWMDKKPVYFLSTAKGLFHFITCIYHFILNSLSDLRLTTVNRKQTDKKKGFLNATVSCPAVCEHYNMYKDAVDQFDKHCLRKNYSVEKSQISPRWWLKLYWGLLDSVLVNSYILW